MHIGTVCTPHPPSDHESLGPLELADVKDRTKVLMRHRSGHLVLFGLLLFGFPILLPIMLGRVDHKDQRFVLLDLVCRGEDMMSHSQLDLTGRGLWVKGRDLWWSVFEPRIQTIIHVPFLKHVMAMAMFGCLRWNKRESYFGILWSY